MHGWDENKLLFEPSLVNCDIQTLPTIRIVKLDRVKRKNYCLLKLKLKEKKCNHCGTNKQSNNKKRGLLSTHYWGEAKIQEEKKLYESPHLSLAPAQVEKRTNDMNTSAHLCGDIWILSGWLLFWKNLTTLFDNSCFKMFLSACLSVYVSIWEFANSGFLTQKTACHCELSE